MKAIRYLFAALLAAALSSCTVKEDRGPCPCVLEIFLGDGSDQYTGKLSLSGWNTGGGRLFLDRIEPQQHGASYSRKVEKGFLWVCAYAGNGSMSLKGDKLVIPEGKECDAVWAYCGGTVDATGESAEERIVMHKQYATVHVRLDTPSPGTDNVVLRAKGTSNGFDISTLAPSHGNFHCFAVLDEEMHFVFRVPRQHDDSLELEIFLDGVLSRTVPAGELIANSGYSWEQDDLEDIYLSLSLFTSARSTVSVSGWDTEAHEITL